MNLNESNIINLIIQLRTHDITEIKKSKLENLLAKYKELSVFNLILENTSSNFDQLFKLFESYHYIKKKDNESDTYDILMDKPLALSNALKYREKNKDKSDLYEMLALLYENEKMNFASIFSSFHQANSKKPQIVKVDFKQNDSVKRKIVSLEEFLYLFFLLLQKKDISLFDDSIFIEAFGFSIVDSISFYNMLEIAFGRTFLKRDVLEIINLFLVNNPFSSRDTNDLNNYIIKRAKTSYPSYLFEVNPVLVAEDALLFEIDQEDYEKLNIFVEQYISITRNNKIA